MLASCSATAEYEAEEDQCSDQGSAYNRANHDPSDSTARQAVRI
jgi:hypothetical protein